MLKFQFFQVLIFGLRERFGLKREYVCIRSNIRNCRFFDNHPVIPCLEKKLKQKHVTNLGVRDSINSKNTSNWYPRPCAMDIRILVLRRSDCEKITNFSRKRCATKIQGRKISHLNWKGLKIAVKIMSKLIAGIMTHHVIHNNLF